MTYASIMVYTDGDAASDNRIRIARALADQFHAALIGVAAGAPRPPMVAHDLIGRRLKPKSPRFQRSWQRRKRNS